MIKRSADWDNDSGHIFGILPDVDDVLADDNNVSHINPFTRLEANEETSRGV